MALTDRQQALCDESRWDFSDLEALFLNCTLKRSPERSHTEGLMAISRAILEANGVAVESLRPVDHRLAAGVYPDMTEHGWPHDDWPALYEKVKAADILVIGSPIWLGEKSSVCTHVIERLYSTSGDLNANGQYAYYGKVGGCLITGNEDGVKHCSMSILYALQHIGYTNRNTTFMTWNLLHFARLLKDAGGVPAHGNQRSEWDAGCRFDFPNPEHR